MSQKQHKNKKELAAELHLAMSGKKKKTKPKYY